MKHKFTKSSLLVFLFFSAIVISRAQIPSASKVASMAVYDALNSANENKPDNTVNYNIVSPAQIASMLGGIEADSVRNCSDMQAINTAYVYVKFLDGSRNVYSIFLKWSHISLVNRETCYFIQPASQLLFEAAIQP